MGLALRMPATPIAVGCYAFFQIERGHPISRFVDLSQFQFRRDTVPIAVNVGSEFCTALARARQLLQANVAGDGFDVACGIAHCSFPSL